MTLKPRFCILATAEGAAYAAGITIEDFDELVAQGDGPLCEIDLDGSGHYEIDDVADWLGEESEDVVKLIFSDPGVSRLLN